MELFDRYSRIATVTAMAFAAATAHAGVSTDTWIPCGSSEGVNSKGLFSALVTYSYSSGSTASVSIVLNNTTLLANGGYITGLALNKAAGTTGMSFVSCSNANFLAMSAVSAPPFGTFTAGGALGANWIGGGSPTGGIAAGSSATFNFSITGSSVVLAALTAEFAFGPNADGNAMAVRFRGGAGDDWSDKVLGCGTPAPGALALLGVVGLLSARRRR
jgi:MYXO-CTERM domain-containing protein